MDGAKIMLGYKKGGRDKTAVTTPYLGNFSGQHRAPTKLQTTQFQCQTRAKHWIYETVTNPQFSFPNFALVSNNGGLETALAGTTTLNVGLEYGGTTYQLKWNGVAGTTMVGVRDSGLCDPIPVTLVAGTAYFLRPYQTNPNGIMYEDGGTGTESQDSANGEAIRYATSGLADQSQGAGAITGGSTSPKFRYSANLAVGQIKCASALIIGTSLEMGFLESAKTGGLGDKGITARMLGKFMPYSNMGQGGMQYLQFLNPANNAVRLAMAQYFSHIAIGCITNDVTIAEADTVTFGRIAQVAALFPDKKIFTFTISPRSTGARTLVDLSDQIPTAPQFTTKLNSVNGMIRASNYQYFDLADASMSSRDSDKWFANGTTNYSSSDGIHFSSAFSQDIADAKLITKGQICRVNY